MLDYLLEPFEDIPVWLCPECEAHMEVVRFGDLKCTECSHVEGCPDIEPDLSWGYP